MVKCCVFGCKNVYKKGKHQKEENLFLCFRYFPINSEIRNMWITNVRQINGYSWQPMNSSVVCSEHFDVSSWEKIREDGKRKLKFGAVPSIFNYLAQISANDHIYSRTLKDITNTRTLLPMERNKSHLSDCDHTYSSKAVSNNKTLLTFADSTKTSVSTSTNTIEKNISKTPEIELDLIDNGNSDIILNNSDVPTNICTITPSNALNSLSELMEEVDNAVTIQTIKEQNIDIMTVSLKKENEQLKKELARVKKIADKMHQENGTLRQSNKKLRREKEIFINMKKKIDENVLQILNKDQKKAIYRKNYQGLRWEPNTVKQALILRLKCGSSGYKEVQKHIPLPSIRTLQNKIKHIEFRPGILQQTFDLLAEEIKHNTEDWKDSVLALDEMSIEPGEMFDPSTNEFIGKTTLASHSGVANKVLVFLLGGITVRWKQAVCFHLTGSKVKDANEGATGQAYANIIKDIIERGERIGLRIHCVVSDMGPLPKMID